MRKSQVASQIFIYLMAVVVAALILLVGYRAISTIVSAIGSGNIEGFKRDFESAVSVTATRYGTVKNFEFSLPTKYDELCFISSLEKETQKFDDVVKKSQMLKQYPLILASVQADAQKNVFLLREKRIEESFYVDGLDVQDNLLCLENSGRKMNVLLKGIGQRALLYT